MASGSASIGLFLGLGLALAACAANPTAEPAPVSTTAGPAPVSTSVGPTTPASTSAVPEPAALEPERWITALAVSPDGRFTYSVASVGVSAQGDRTWNGRIMVDAGAGPVPAIADERDEFDTITGLAFGPAGLVAFVSSDENFGAQLFLGRLTDDGAIIDLHRIPEEDGQMVGPPRFDDVGNLQIGTVGGVMVHNPATDPFFVMSASPMPVIESDSPLAPVAETEGFWARDEPGFWYRGATLASQAACGSSTLYKDDADGFARVLAAGIELDRVVDVDVSPTTSSAGADTAGASRSVVISTECPGDYEGRRLHFGFEHINYGDGGPRWEWPFEVKPVEHAAVAEVLAVREQRDPVDRPFGAVSSVEIDVIELDGSAATITIDLPF